MLSVKIDDIKDFVSTSKSLKEIAKSEIGEGDIKLVTKDNKLFMQASESGVYFLSKIIANTTVVEEGTCFISAKELANIITCINQAGLTTIKLTVEDKVLIIDGSILGEIRIPLPANQQAWKRSPLSREDIEWELLTIHDNTLLTSLNKLKDFHAKNYVKLVITKENCFMDISAVNETGTAYTSCRNKLQNTPSFDYSFIANIKAITGFLKISKEEEIKLYINKNTQGKVDLDKDNLIYKLEYPDCKFVFYSNYTTPGALGIYENYFLKQQPICELQLSADSLINAVKWQLFKLNPSGSMFISFDPEQATIGLSDKEESKDISGVPIINKQGIWEAKYYSVMNINKLVTMFNRNDTINFKLIKQEMGDEEESPIFVIIASLLNSSENFIVAINFSEEIF